ncbi:hypothetical protein CH063_09957 [Colletotrichum higginsianum]|uniref:Uncharacterized protein n=1 Tax=Colletotrichum higginsianum (strain IMI 349063) TaxID=759273 RepID=H1VFK8_COLHI|nr:hypothetical protein CH063_09957 [Colletotrichum higginsianum]
MSFWARYQNFPVRLPIPAPRLTSATETSVFLEDVDAADATQNGHFKALEHRNLSSSSPGTDATSSPHCLDAALHSHRFSLRAVLSLDAALSFRHFLS